MICVLFLATRMRAIMLTNGETEKYGLPQSWCKNGMVVCASATTVLTLAGIARNSLRDYETSATAKHLVTLLYGVTMAAACASILVVCYGLYSMDTPKGLGGKSVHVSDAANCVVQLTVAYFVVFTTNSIATVVDDAAKSAGKEVWKS